MNEQSRSPSLDYSLLSGEAIARELGTDVERGLSGAEAARLQAEFGPNELRAAASTPAWRRVLAQFQDPLVYLLLGAIVVALAAWLIEGREGLPVDAIVIALVVVANAILGFVQEARAANWSEATSCCLRKATPSAPMVGSCSRRAPAARPVAGLRRDEQQRPLVRRDPKMGAAAMGHITWLLTTAPIDPWLGRISSRKRVAGTVPCSSWSPWLKRLAIAETSVSQDMQHERPHLRSYKDRHGKDRWRFLRSGKVIHLPGQPGDLNFEEAYEAAVAGRERRKAKVIAHPNAARGTRGAG